MREHVSALLIHGGQSAFAEVKFSLESVGIEVQAVRSCGEALLRLWGPSPPHLVFTETHLLDGIWADVLSMTRKSPLPVNVIVVSRLADVNLYVQVLERGAFDCIIPPFEAMELDHVVHCAIDNVMAQRVRQWLGASDHAIETPPEATPQEEESQIDDDMQATSTP